MNDEYSVKDYGIFSDAIATTTSLNKEIEDFLTIKTECEKNIKDESIFMGPISESCTKEFANLKKSFQTMMENFNKINKYLEEVAKNYQEGDKNASNVILDIGAPIASKYLNPANISGSHLTFINSIKDGAVETYKKYGVLPSLTMAQAILESGWGKSAIGNNIFGIKAGSSWNGKTQTCKTGEQRSDGSRYTTTATFRDYDSVSQSIEDHAKLLTNSRYKPVIEAKNYKEACTQVRKCGYATSLDYSENLISIIEKYGLDQWDKKL